MPLIWKGTTPGEFTIRIACYSEKKKDKIYILRGKVQIVQEEVGFEVSQPSTYQ